MKAMNELKNVQNALTPSPPSVLGNDRWPGSDGRRERLQKRANFGYISQGVKHIETRATPVFYTK